MKKLIFPILLILFILITEFVSPENPPESLGLVLVIGVTGIEAWKPNTIPQIVVDVVGFIGLNLVYWGGPFSWAAALALSLRILFALVYLSGCAYLIYRVYDYLRDAQLRE